jgi:solute carrier family 45 protein 1/2/4
MTGFSAFPVSNDAEAGAQMQWSGISRVLGPKWLKMPFLTVGMLGLQIIWSVEMSYGELTRVLPLAIR